MSRHVERHLEAVELHRCGRCGTVATSHGDYILHGCGGASGYLPRREPTPRMTWPLYRALCEYGDPRMMAGDWVPSYTEKVPSGGWPL
jgi:uncharacterized C2H2 Zn-finger protein